MKILEDINRLCGNLMMEGVKLTTEKGNYTQIMINALKIQLARLSANIAGISIVIQELEKEKKEIT